MPVFWNIPSGSGMKRWPREGGEQPLIKAADSQTQFSVHSTQKKTYLLFLLWQLSPLSGQHLRDFRERQIGVLGPQPAPLFVQENRVTAPGMEHTERC